ncbi:carboxylesterase family protein [Aspergillus campestris IBT 28561]|uniref:Carboxylic ester hydrolase n=1 Tax=Aspergillus campestris (strain IBT 28561) TaxID=1392248 RepID=A0A2I1D4Z8_ASPC2|nr:carboxylesterase family protein [Aspergillus campestris IBT 28561]PKY04961.1 carboxylesterase family protein [Aspergillus campestris IBT 28561]
MRIPNLALTALLVLQVQTTELLVNTTSGPIQGFYNTTSRTVRAFLGIPYAEPPVGGRRFALPVAKSPVQKPFVADVLPPICPGVYSPSNESIISVLPYLQGSSSSMSEDCLRVNVWASAAAHPSRNGKAAVMVFIHGGVFYQGSPSSPFMDGSYIVRDNEDVIVVSIQYRLTIFGYPGAPGIPPAQQNVGLRDQRMAIEWVHQNIAQFGGDPDRILLFGQSAGAVSTDMYLYAHHDDPLVHGAILQSGVAGMWNNDILHAQANWTEVSTALGCGSGQDTLKCMREQPIDQIIDAVRASGNTFYPVQDNITVFPDYSVLSRQGKITPVPTLIGIVDRELAIVYNLSSKAINESAMYARSQTEFNCPTHETAQLRLQSNIPTYRYVYHGNYTNISPVPWLGAYHGSDLPAVFGSYNMSGTGIASTPREIADSRYIQDAWVAFAKDPHNGLARLGWPQYDPTSKSEGPKKR